MQSQNSTVVGNIIDRKRTKLTKNSVKFNQI